MGEAEDRKQRSNELIATKGVSVAPMLPLIEDVAGSRRRTTEEVARRALALATVAVKGEGHAVATAAEVRTFTDDLVATLDIDGDLTPAEQAFVAADHPSDHDVVQFTWRYECCWTLHWALGLVDSLPWPDALCDAATVMRIVRDRGRDGYLAAAELRPQDELLDQADLIYRIHWAVVDARLGGRSVDQVDGGVVLERHHALNWLIGYQDQDWDEISTDT